MVSAVFAISSMPSSDIFAGADELVVPGCDFDCCAISHAPLLVKSNVGHRSQHELRVSEKFMSDRVSFTKVSELLDSPEVAVKFFLQQQQ